MGCPKFPPRACALTDVNIPPNSQFVIAKCLREHHLAGGTGENHYNERVAECRIGANLLYKHFLESKGLENDGKVFLLLLLLLLLLLIIIYNYVDNKNIQRITNNL